MGDELGDRDGRGWEQLLDVVEHEVRAPLADRRTDCGGSAFGRTEAVRELVQQLRSVAERGEGDEARAAVGVVCEKACELDREAGLADATRADDRQHPWLVLEPHRDSAMEIVLAAEEAGCRGWQLDRSGAAQRGKRLGSELEEPCAAVEVLEPVQAELGCLVGDQPAGWLCQQDLAPMSECSDACAAVDVDSDIALGGEGRLACVQAHPHPDRARLETFPTGSRGGCGAGCCREGDKERVALRVDLHTTVRDERLAQHTPVLGQRLGIPRRPQRVEQARRALDVREQERDRALGQLSHHWVEATA